MIFNLGNPIILETLIGVTQLYKLSSAKDFTPTLTLPFKGEGIFSQLRKSYPDSDD